MLELAIKLSFFVVYCYFIWDGGVCRKIKKISLLINIRKDTSASTVITAMDTAFFWYVKLRLFYFNINMAAIGLR